jgi:hypothetical protein
MKTITKTGRPDDRMVKLSTLWIFAMLNYIYADVTSLMDPKALKQVLTGYVGSLQITDGFLLGAAILMETAIAMVLLCRILPYSVNRWANIIVGILHTAAVLASMLLGSTPAAYYIFFAVIEICCTLFIVGYAWLWPPQAKATADADQGREKKGEAE